MSASGQVDGRGNDHAAHDAEETVRFLLNAGAMLLLALIWGLSIPVTKLGLVSTPPLVLTALRFLVAVPLLCVLVVGRAIPPMAAMPRLAGLGVLGIGIGQVAQALGVEGTTASAGTIISATIPVFIVVFAALRLAQPVTGVSGSASWPRSSASRWSPWETIRTGLPRSGRASEARLGCCCRRSPSRSTTSGPSN